jgi:homoserine dehydrogenase
LDTVPLQALSEKVAQRARNAPEAGKRLRQIARIVRQEGRILSAVEFEPVEPRSVFGTLSAEWNDLEIRYTSGEVVAVRGRGAGRWPTTEAVAADVFNAIRARTCST